MANKLNTHSLFLAFLITFAIVVGLSAQVKTDSATMEEKLKNVVPFKEEDGFIEVEAEAFQFTSANETPRNWYTRPKDKDLNFEASSLQDHSDGAGNGLYIEALPDTRVTHDDKLIKGRNFFPGPGRGRCSRLQGKLYNSRKILCLGKGVFVGFRRQWSTCRY